MRVAFVLAGLLLLPLSVSAAEKLKVVTSFSILADMAHQIGGEHIEVINIVGPDKDARAYKPTADDAKNLAHADVIIENGLGFEPWMDQLVAKSGTKKVVTVASTGVIPRTVSEDGKTVTDPHAWQSLPDAELYMNNIVNALSAVDPEHTNAYISASKVYNKQLHSLKTEAKLKLATVPLGTLPAGSRRFVVSHEAFGYLDLGKAYDIEFVAAQDVASAGEPSQAQVAALTKQVGEVKAKAVFLDNVRDPATMKQIADQTGVPVAGTLYSDALATKGPASTFAGMYKANINALYDALNKP
ncbi:metal ABC transporter solute-binding protein, Zn/Mn family [Pseudomonas sp. NA-150]|uniref:metal ABC transporter solute-binding protein, Zn/Mn family n=1 Tax=Pseudomonas sp. NA-150 TaxID=3367525 RepID=UPI0037CA88E6